MSADDYYVIKPHPKGGYAAVHAFMSSECGPVVRPDYHKPFPTVLEAIAYAQEDSTEYGVQVDRSITHRTTP